MTDLALLAKVKLMAQACRDLAIWCDETDKGYVRSCLEDAEAALELAIKRLKGESTLTD